MGMKFASFMEVVIHAFTKLRFTNIALEQEVLSSAAAKAQASTTDT